MHSCIFQLSTRPIGEEKYLSEDVVLQRVDASLGESYADYVVEIDDEEKKKTVISELAFFLPKEMFKGNDDGTIITYIGGFEKWVKKVYFPLIQEAAMTLMVDKAFSVGFGSAYEVKKRIENPLNLGYLFIITDHQNPDNAITEPVKKSGDFMGDFIKHLKPGTRIYIGGVYDYHF